MKSTITDGFRCARRRVRTRRGATMVEYSLMLAMIAMALALAAHAIGHVLKSSYATANAAVLTANSADTAAPDSSGEGAAGE
jgi:Flp pilus assembly pilin Flp